MFTFSFENNFEVSEPNELNENDPCSMHSLSDLISEDVRISYNVVGTKSGSLPRRDIFDVKYQLMKKDNLTEAEQLLISAEDVKCRVYEGGLKVWEGTYDLIEVLAQRSPKTVTGAMELGCGAGLPLISLFVKCHRDRQPCRFIFADYNTEILSLLTAPNFILAWLYARGEITREGPGEAQITLDLIKQCVADLESRQIEISFVSGGWGKGFVDVVDGIPLDLVLASETIYSLESLPYFVLVIKSLLEKNNADILVAAKKVYFGVGGGIVEFERLANQSGLTVTTLKSFGEVGRVVLQVRITKSLV